MVKLVKSQVKCYKKKTKKNVGGQKKTYEYNQYLVPLKKSDNLDCSMDVFIIPKNDIKDLLDEEGELKDISRQEDEYKSHFAQYETELAELEWKHNKLSKSYKELLNKHNKTRRKQQEMEDKIKTLESDRMKLINALKEERRINGGIPAKKVQNNKLSSGQKSPKSDKIRAGNEKISTHASEDKEDKDIWTTLKSRLSKKEQEEKEE
jgi:predicted nuclease with TOPRIM domain